MAMGKKQNISTYDDPNIISEVNSKVDTVAGIQKEETLWSVFHRLKAVLDTPPDEKSSLEKHSGHLSEINSGSPCTRVRDRYGHRHSTNSGRRVHHEVIYDDSKRVVDMTEIQPNLFIGDE